ncbi:3,4-dihydroxy-2-butanone-4-phosphate synthase [Weissella minor]|uniref:3,4-dihydroxy-2-butanone 4-phosphate synthase n=1 Tax=Weissella minor TaxID=1620 RepID=A0A0R2JI25_9LACO|nr:3,4-dihydroxy-2-butanone-4-phosphate synthase [Weissella minor]KRN76958.1 34-dihydroxy-2-butanone 4-phosphate synthase gtp cyclohydrolase ii [Weissella minor]
MNTSIEEAVRYMAQGGLAVIVDDETRENEGDLVGVGSKMTPENVNFMVTHARGLLCAPITQAIADRLDLPQMVANNTEVNGTRFTVSIDGSHEATGVTTGVSAFDRSATLQHLANPNAKVTDFVHPGHSFPLVGEDGGVMARDGHTEAAIDLARLAGEPEVGAICEILLEDGHMAREQDLRQFAADFQLPFISIEQLTEYVREHGNHAIV